MHSTGVEPVQNNRQSLMLPLHQLCLHLLIPDATIIHPIAISICLIQNRYPSVEGNIGLLTAIKLNPNVKMPVFIFFIIQFQLYNCHVNALVTLLIHLIQFHSLYPNIYLPNYYPRQFPHLLQVVVK